MGVYKPDWQSRNYHRLSRNRRVEIVREVNRRFREQTGVSRLLNPLSRKDRELRVKWLRIRDSVINRREQKLAEEDMEFRRELFMHDMPTIVADEMDFMGWKQAAELLETWTERTPAVAPNYSAPVTNVIKIDWVLHFARPKMVFNDIIKNRIWTNPASQKRIAEILKKRPVAVGQTFGGLSMAVTDVDKNWINARPVKRGEQALAGVLGAFELQVAISGKLLSNTGREFELKIEEVGIYVKDSFDFNGSQFLGVWGYRDAPVSNIDFRIWRTKNNAGGDFRVFSDVKRTKLSTPDIVKGPL